MIKLVEVSKKGEQYDPAIGLNKVTFGLREVFVNPNMIVSMRADKALQEKNKKNRLFDNLNENVEFHYADSQRWSKWQNNNCCWLCLYCVRAYGD